MTVHAPQQQRAAHCGTWVRPGAPVTEAAGARLEVEGARLGRCIRAGSRWVMPAFLPRWQRRGCHGQLCQHLLQALLFAGFLSPVGERCSALLLQAASLLEFALCLRFPFQPQLMLPLPLKAEEGATWRHGSLVSRMATKAFRNARSGRNLQPHLQALN